MRLKFESQFFNMVDTQNTFRSEEAKSSTHLWFGRPFRPYTIKDGLAIA